MHQPSSVTSLAQSSGPSNSEQGSFGFAVASSSAWTRYLFSTEQCSFIAVERVQLGLSLARSSVLSSLQLHQLSLLPTLSNVLNLQLHQPSSATSFAPSSVPSNLSWQESHPMSQVHYQAEQAVRQQFESTIGRVESAPRPAWSRVPASSLLQETSTGVLNPGLH